MNQPDILTLDNPSLEDDLLSLCAILRWFDGDLLRELAGSGGDVVEALLASDKVMLAAEPTGAYQLREDVRTAAITRLRAERPSDELTLHRHVFEYVLRQLRESGPDDRRAIDEETLLHHLGELFLLIAARQEWHTLMECVATVRSAGPRQACTQHWLTFYDGFVAVRTQEYQRGETLLSALLAQPDLAGKLHVQVLNALGQTCYLQAQHDRALGFYQRVYSVACASHDTFYQAAALANMSMIYKDIGTYDRAFELGQQSLSLFRELRDYTSQAHILYEIGQYALRLGRWHIAQSYFHEAIGMYETRGIHAALAYLHWGQGVLYHMIGDDGLSEMTYLRALAIEQAQPTRQPTLTIDIYFRLGFLYQTQGRLDEALSHYERARTLAHQLHNPYSATFIDYRRGNVFERQGKPSAALAAYHKAIEGVEAMRGAAEVEEIKLGLLGTTQQIYESAVRLCLALGQIDEAFNLVERARSRAFLDLLSNRRAASATEAPSSMYTRIAQPVVTLAELQARLPPDALLVEYYTMGVLPRGEALINQIPAENARLREHLTLPPQIVVFAVTRDHIDVFQPRLDPNKLRPQEGDPGPGRRLLRGRLLVDLYEQLITPFAHLLHGQRLLYLIPHGPLHYVPFMALQSAAGAHLVRACGPAIALAPSATVLLRTCPDRPRRAAGPPAPPLALGYNDVGEDALRYAEVEAGHVARLAGGRAWLGPAPKSARLADVGRQARWLHIAGHAVYDPHDPLGSYLKLGQDEALSARDIMGRLDLGADLVTLSACMSGVTHVVPGDELLGLQRALLYAGAPAVVCTLWEAADLVALQVMDRFYAGLLRGTPPAAALRDAQVAVRAMTGRDLLATIERWRADNSALADALKDLPDLPPELLDEPLYADPQYWAPFMLIGKAD